MANTHFAMRTNLSFLLILFFAAASTAYSQQALECSTASGNQANLGEHWVQPRSAEETARFKQSPHGVRRVDPHTIELGWTGGKLTLKDKPPYDDYDSVHWTYCGYNQTLKLHMALKGGDGVFTGVLIDDATGTILPGGQKVLFSKSAAYYLAYYQDDGRDGKSLKLYRRDGTLLWTGFDGLLTADEKYQTAYFEKMQWDDQERPQAVAHDIKSDGIQTVTLKPNSAGKWEWAAAAK